MTKLVKRYLKLDKLYAFNLPKENEEQLLDELERIEKEMSFEELLSLKGCISERQFFHSIVPLINKKCEQAAKITAGAYNELVATAI